MNHPNIDPKLMKRIPMQEGESSPDLPDGIYPIDAKDKPLIRKLGRELEQWFMQKAKENEGMHLSIIISVCDYVVSKAESRKLIVINHELGSERDAINAEAKAAIEKTVAFKAKQKEFITSSAEYLGLINKIEEYNLAEKVIEPFQDVIEEKPEEGSVAPTDMQSVEDSAKDKAPADAPIPSPFTAGGEEGGQSVEAK